MNNHHFKSIKLKYILNGAAIVIYVAIVAIMIAML